MCPGTFHPILSATPFAFLLHCTHQCHLLYHSTTLPQSLVGQPRSYLLCSILLDFLSDCTHQFPLALLLCLATAKLCRRISKILAVFWSARFFIRLYTSSTTLSHYRRALSEILEATSQCLVLCSSLSLPHSLFSSPRIRLSFSLSFTVVQHPAALERNSTQPLAPKPCKLI